MSVRALGIDVGVEKGLDLVVMDERRLPLRVLSHVGIGRLSQLIEELAPDAIAIDAPP